MSDGAGPVLQHGRWTRRSLGALAFVGLSVMPATLSATLADGERTTLSLRGGFGFLT